ncbi:WD repeat-containing protein on Y chromosome [Scleropages formosus]|uniref:WD repeat-containing protein on Y chromosome n=1 Tax=Scleropages formosus TaxID=113540 RepID=UPI0010FA6700|nr:WD repeat-containing protein on Y chromosome-like [Scleropages formosus]
MCDVRKCKDSSWNAYEREPPSFITRHNQGQNVHLEDELHLEHLLLLREAFDNHAPSAVASGPAGGVEELVRRVRRPGRGFTRQEGRMNSEEFQAALRALLGSERWDSQTEQLFNKVDASCNGYVDWDKLCSYLLLQHREKEFAARPRDSVLSSQPLVRHCVHNKQETTTRVLAVTHPLPLRFFSVSKQGTMTIWDSNLDILRTHEVPGDSSESHGDRRKFRKWTTDAVYMPNVHKIAVTTTSRDIHFFDVSTSKCFEEFHLFGIKNVPTSLCYWYDDKSPGHRSVLLWGDDSGGVSLLWFLHPQKGMFETTFSNNNRPQKIFMHDICNHSRLVSYQMAHRIHEDPVNRVICDPQADLLITSSTSATTSVVITDISFKKKCYIWKINKGVTCFDFCKPLNLLVTAGMDPAVRLWNQYVTSRPMATLHGHCTTVLDVVIYKAMGQIFSYSKDAVLKVWDVPSQSCLRSLLLKFPCVQAGRPLEHGNFPFLLLSAVPHMLLVSCRDYLGLLHLDRGDSGRAGCLTHSAPISSALYNPILKQVATGCDDSTVCLWDVETGAKCLQLSNVHGKEEITCMTFDLSYRRLITGARNGTIKVWNVINGQNLHKLEAIAEAEVTGVICLPDNKLLAVGWSQQITQYNITDPNVVYIQADLSWKSGQVHKEDILAADLCSARGLLATASFDGEIIIWTLETQRPLLHIHRASNIRVQPPVDKLLFLQQRARGGQWRTGALLVSSEAGHLCWWSIVGPEHKHGCFYAPQTADECVLGLNSDQDNRLLVSGDTAGSIQVWDISQFGLGAEKQSSTDQPPLLHCWRAHDSTLVSVELLTFNDQLFLLSASTDQTARLWCWDGQYVGFFGQDQKWNLHDPTTYQLLRDPWGNCKVAVEEVGSGSRQSYGCEDQGPGKAAATGESHGSRTQTSSPPKHGMILEGSINPQGDSHQTANKTAALRPQVSQDLQKRRAARQERRLAFRSIDASKMSRVSGVCTPFQALAMQECKEFQLPRDLPMSTWMLRQGLRSILETGLGSSPQSTCSSSTERAEDVV